jgi:hypothetical protein
MSSNHIGNIETGSVRYLQPMSLLTVLVFAVLVKTVVNRRPRPASTPAL